MLFEAEEPPGLPATAEERRTLARSPQASLEMLVYLMADFATEVLHNPAFVLHEFQVPDFWESAPGASTLGMMRQPAWPVSLVGWVRREPDSARRLLDADPDPDELARDRLFGQEDLSLEFREWFLFMADRDLSEEVQQKDAARLLPEHSPLRRAWLGAELSREDVLSLVSSGLRELVLNQPALPIEMLWEWAYGTPEPGWDQRFAVRALHRHPALTAELMGQLLASSAHPEWLAGHPNLSTEVAHQLVRRSEAARAALAVREDLAPETYALLRRYRDAQALLKHNPQARSTRASSAARSRPRMTATFARGAAQDDGDTELPE